MPLPAGAKFGPYEILSPLGVGGMGEVYRARDTRLNRDVALKILPADFAADPVRRARFEQEARAVAALNHPNIVAVFDVGDGYIVSELVDGEPLRAGKLALRKTLDVAVQIAGGPEVDIPFNSTLPIWSIYEGAAAKDGRLLMEVCPVDNWFCPVGVLDTHTGTVTQVPVAAGGDLNSIQWTPDGRIFATDMSIQTSLWRFQK